MRWFGAQSVRDASRALAIRAASIVSLSGGWILLVGEDGPLRRGVAGEFERRGLCHRWVRTVGESVPSPSQEGTPACIVVADVKAARITEAARAALLNPGLAEVPVEYATGLESERLQLREQDEYADAVFVSPVLLSDPSPYALYAASLERFEQKCGLRDYLDLYQLLRSVIERKIPGDVAEFGSYKGHSGWLIGKTLEALDSDKAVYMFDTFDVFPAESAGVDYFWSNTHRVNLHEVREKLADLPKVHLVPGEFEHTVPGTTVDRLALAYVDCDSHRAVSYIARALFNDHLSPGGVMVFEDYGHPALLGCRIAVHEYFDHRTDCVRFFSQFSGLYVVVKLAVDAGLS